MDLKNKSEEEYKILVEDCTFLVNSELERVEAMKAANDHQGIALSLPKIISAVNFIGYLRGQDGMFYDFRPHISFQKDLYAMEDKAEKRLVSLIDYVKTTESKSAAESRIKEYYLKNRGFDVY